jgi:WhiB family transcriptional regulator, redox-sensing transcriptional regulator
VWVAIASICKQPAEHVVGYGLGWRREFEGASVVASGTITISSWQLRAACRGPHAEVFFPPEGAEHRHERLERELEAKAICATCVVRRPCLDYALAIDEPIGIWGGLNERERKRISHQKP